MTETPLLSQQQLIALDLQRIPQHIAIIPDGNRRWAKMHDLDNGLGHKQGGDNLLNIVKAAAEMGVKTLTFYTFSTENWLRPKDEVDCLMALLESYLMDQCSAMVQNGIRLETVGSLEALPKSVQQELANAKNATAHGKKIDLVLAVNYGARDDIVRAVKKLAADWSKKSIKSEDISETLISSYLDTHRWPDPDLLIRTSGENRISNFLLWELSYTELYFTETLWPDFSPTCLYHAVLNYQKRIRRLGE